MRRAIEWFREIWYWLSEGKAIFLGFLVLAVALAMVFSVWKSEQSIRITGYILQLIGIAITLRGILSVREHFGQQPLRKIFLIWMKRFPRWKRKPIMGSGAVVANQPTVSASGIVWSPDDPEWELEKRVENILKNVDSLSKKQSELIRDVNSLKVGQDEQRKLFEDRTAQLERGIRSDLEILHTGDVLISLVGVLWMTAGISLSTLSKELSRWLYQ